MYGGGAEGWSDGELGGGWKGAVPSRGSADVPPSPTSGETPSVRAEEDVRSQLSDENTDTILTI